MSDSESVDYLQTGFDPWTLTVPRLRSILVSHNVQYPANAKKPQLVDIFNESVLPQSKKILAARSRAKRSSKGIVDADSSQERPFSPENDLFPPPSSTKRSMTRSKSPRKASTRVKVEESEEETVPAVVASPRKRISRSNSRQPRQASDTDTGGDQDLPRLVQNTPRQLPAYMKPEFIAEALHRSIEDDSVFTQDNPFQSGSSSPPVPRTQSERRKTTGMQLQTPKSTSAARRRTDAPSERIDTATESFETPMRRPSGTRFGVAKAPELDAVEIGEEFAPDQQAELEKEQKTTIVVKKAKSGHPTRRMNLATPLWVLAFTFLISYLGWYRQEKIAVGYCGLGRDPTPIIPANMELPSWVVTLLEPQCEPCPPHAYCYQDYSVRCESDFILKPHPLSLGGIVPLPPTCEPDGEKVRRVKVVADKAVEELRERRAQWECGEPVDAKGQPVDSPAIEAEELKEAVSRKRSKRMAKDEFDDLWAIALDEIKDREEVQVHEKANSGAIPNTYLSSTSLARLPLSCAIRRSIRIGLARYRLQIIGIGLVVLLALYGRSRYLAHRATAAQVPALVDLVLERLASQKELGDEGFDDTFLFLPNLRDDVLRSIHSLSERERIWQKVRAVVEMNSNVRTGQRESRHGEVGRAWEWIGPGAASDVSRRRSRLSSGRVSWGPDVKDEDGPSPAEMSESGGGAVHRRWEESRPIY